MKDSLQPGLTQQHRFVIPLSKTVSSLYPESEEFIQMPEVFATGFLVGFLEWACILCINPHLDWPEEQSVGTHIDISHEAATPPGFEVIADVKLVEVDGRRLLFEIEAHDGVDMISKGRHERFIIHKSKFDQRLEEKHRAHFNDVLI
jgi:fluoroacetyl-CoA thioesterase